MPLRVICKACGAENPMGDLFCRQCGAEIDINNLTPDQIVQEKKTGQVRKAIDLASSIIVLVGLILAVISMVPLPGSDVPEINKKDVQAIEGSVGAIKDSFNRDAAVKTVMVDPILAGPVYHKLMFEDSFTEKAEVGITPTITEDGDVYVKLIMKTLICGFPFRVIVNGKLEQSGRNDYFHWPVAKNTNLAVTSTWVGLLPFGSNGAVIIRSFFMDFLNTSGRSVINSLAYVKVTGDRKFFYVRAEGTEGSGIKKK